MLTFFRSIYHFLPSYHDFRSLTKKVHKFCGPSRAALQSGRLPIHVTVLDNPLDSVNPKDPVGGFQGIPRNMTGIASKMKQAGYSTHAYGSVHSKYIVIHH